MISIAVTLLICGTFTYVARLYLPLFKQATEQRSSKAAELVPLPPDLVSYATQWRDPWARSENLKVIQELYTETGSWEAVRRALSQ